MLTAFGERPSTMAIALTPEPSADGAPRRPRPPRRVIVVASLRTTATVAVLVTLYAVLPFDGNLSTRAGVALVIGLLAFIGLAQSQVRSILRAPYPAIRAAEVLALLVPVFILAFASYYYISDRQQEGSYSTSLSRVDALYFTVTVLSTV